jgi:riboflavin synthase
MFTGLIEAIGQVVALERTRDGSRMTIQTTPDIMADLAMGHSIAVNGVCTTVICLDDTGFTLEASPETLSKTTFKWISPGDRVNLERPLLPTTRLGGHFVTGHVDGIATLISHHPEGISHMMTFQWGSLPAISCSLVSKGSVAVDGISLTVNDVGEDCFTVAIIPHTMAHTTLGYCQVGDRVNIETDILGKYIHQALLPTFQQTTPIESNADAIPEGCCP